MRIARPGTFVIALWTVACLASLPALAGHRRPRVSVHMHGGYYWGSPYYSYGRFYPYPYPYYPHYPRYAYPARYALVDTDIQPEEARVYLDGEPIGEADDFDGFPDYLELSPGKHTIEFRKSGYRTLRFSLNAKRGFLYNVDREMRPGEEGETEERELDRRAGPDRSDDHLDDVAVPPSEPLDEEQEGEPDESELSGEADEDLPPDREAGEDLPPDREADEGLAPDEEIDTETDRSATEPERGATIVFQVRPTDAAVYLDGKFLGAGESLVGPEGLRIDPGRHRLEIVKPGYRPYRRTIDLRGGERKVLTIRLESS